MHFLYIYIYMRIQTYTYLYIYTHICICICIYLHICTYMYLCVCIYIHIAEYVYVHIYVYTHMHIHICLSLYLMTGIQEAGLWQAESREAPGADRGRRAGRPWGPLVRGPVPTIKALRGPCLRSPCNKHDTSLLVYWRPFWGP